MNRFGSSRPLLDDCRAAWAESRFVCICEAIISVPCCKSGSVKTRWTKCTNHILRRMRIVTNLWSFRKQSETANDRRRAISGQWVMAKLGVPETLFGEGLTDTLANAGFFMETGTGGRSGGGKRKDGERRKGGAREGKKASLQITSQI